MRGSRVWQSLSTFVLALVVERPFRRYACPLGAVQGLIGKVSPIAVQRDADAYPGCDLCHQACPMGIPMNTRTRVTDASCIGCGLRKVSRSTQWTLRRRTVAADDLMEGSDPPPRRSRSTST
jgi:flavoprotein